MSAITNYHSHSTTTVTSKLKAVFHRTLKLLQQQVEQYVRLDTSLVNLRIICQLPKSHYVLSILCLSIQRQPFGRRNHVDTQKHHQLHLSFYLFVFIYSLQKSFTENHSDFVVEFDTLCSERTCICAAPTDVRSTQLYYEQYRQQSTVARASTVTQ